MNEAVFQNIKKMYSDENRCCNSLRKLHQYMYGHVYVDYYADQAI